MTPETPDPPPVSPDPWKDVDRLLSAQSDAEIGFMGYVLNTKALDLLNDLHAARAADALRHQRELEAKDSEIALQDAALKCYAAEQQILRAQVVRLQAKYDDVMDTTNGALHARAEELRAALSTAEATIQQQTAELATVAAERDAERQRWLDTRCREVEHSIRADRAEATIASLEADNAELEADVARLESRLEQAHVEPGETHE